MSFNYFAPSSSPQPKSHSRVTDKPIHFLSINRSYASGLFVADLPDVHGFRRGRFRLDAEKECEVFPEDQIQLIGIAAHVFDDLADLEPNGNLGWSELKKRLASLLSHPISGAARQVGISISGVSQIWPEVCPARKQRPRGSFM
jgi:hypothetical protein